MFNIQESLAIVLIGVGATAVLDLWLLVLKRLGVPTGSFALIGRWVAHMARGRFSHASIAKSEPVRNELAVGWATHYAVGIVFAGILLSAMIIGGELSQSRLGLPNALSGVFQGLLLVLLLACDTLIHFRIRARSAIAHAH